MVKKTKAKIGADDMKTTTKKVSAIDKMTTISFRTKLVQKKKAEKIFEDMGISTSAALNMFLAQVVRDKGMPFLPSTVKKDGGSAEPKLSASRPEMDTAGYIALEELWDEL